jgi:hypothetical protein
MAAVSVFAQSPSLASGPAKFSATAIDPNRGAAGMVEIRVDRWSTEAERNRLMETLVDKGPEKLLDAIGDVKPVGTIKTPGSLAYDLRFARRTPLADGGERVILVTDRRIGFWEQFNSTRSSDYPFTVIELRLDNHGEGEGKMSLATKITADKENNIVVLENYDLQPVLLNNIKRETATH